MLYTLLEREVIPQFYARDEKGIPSQWVQRIRESMARLTPLFSANRAVREYTERYYLPAASAYQRRVADKAEASLRIVDWQHELERNWANLRFGPIKTDTRDGLHIFEAQVYLGEFNTDHVAVELYAEGVDGGAAFRLRAKRGAPLVGSRGFTYSAAVPSTRPATDYSLRIIPDHPEATVPLEAAHILWQR
jgi:glycogen phosphorylase